MVPAFWEEIPQRQSPRQFNSCSQNIALYWHTYDTHSMLDELNANHSRKQNLHVFMIHRTVSGLEQALSRYSLSE